MEFLGSSFSLKITEDFFPIFDSTFAVYKKWLGFNTQETQNIKTPECFSENCQFYYQEIIKHLSTFFEKRTIPSILLSITMIEAYLEKYYSKCKEIIKTYNKLCREFKKQLSEETFEVLLKVNLGIADMFLSLPYNPNEISEQLTVSLFSNVFDILLFSGSQNRSLFLCFSDLSSRWLHRENFLNYWFSLCVGLNQRLLNILFGHPYQYRYFLTYARKVCGEVYRFDMQNYLIVMSSDIEANVYNVTDEQVVYLWFRLVFLFDQRFTSPLPKGKVILPYPEIYNFYIWKITQMLKEFKKVGGLITRKCKEIFIEKDDYEQAMRFRVDPIGFNGSDFNANIKELYSLFLLEID